MIPSQKSEGRIWDADRFHLLSCSTSSHTSTPQCELSGVTPHPSAFCVSPWPMQALKGLIDESLPLLRFAEVGPVQLYRILKKQFSCLPVNSSVKVNPSKRNSRGKTNILDPLIISSIKNGSVIDTLVKYSQC